MTYDILLPPDGSISKLQEAYKKENSFEAESPHPKVTTVHFPLNGITNVTKN